MNGIAEGVQTPEMLDRVLTRQRKHWNQVWLRRPKVIDEICAALSVCRSLLAWTQLHDLNFNTVLDWIKTDPTRAAQFKAAEANLAYQLRLELFAIAEDLAVHYQLDANGKMTPATRSRFQLARMRTSARRNYLRGLPPPSEPPKTKRSLALPTSSQSAIRNSQSAIDQPLGGEDRGEGVAPAAYPLSALAPSTFSSDDGASPAAPFPNPNLIPASPIAANPCESVESVSGLSPEIHLPQSTLDPALPPKTNWLQLLGLKPKP